MGNAFIDETTKQKHAIGERMRARREYLRLTQQDVADYLDVNRVTYTQYEIGKNQIPSADMPRLAKVLNVPVAYFFGEVEPEEIEHDEFIQNYSGRPPDQKAQARRVLSALFAAQDEEARALAREETTHGKNAEPQTGSK